MNMEETFIFILWDIIWLIVDCNSLNNMFRLNARDTLFNVLSDVIFIFPCEAYELSLRWSPSIQFLAML